jgi:phenylalanyl-tRNA synthetase beta chain
MDVSYEWLKELVDVPVSPEELADKVSRTGD